MDTLAGGLDFEGFCLHRKQARVLQRGPYDVLACLIDQAFLAPSHRQLFHTSGPKAIAGNEPLCAAIRICPSPGESCPTPKPFESTSKVGLALVSVRHRQTSQLTRDGGSTIDIVRCCTRIELFPRLPSNPNFRHQSFFFFLRRRRAS
jgi:hypothetical protein